MNTSIYNTPYICKPKELTHVKSKQMGGLWTMGHGGYLATGLIVVEVHGGSRVLSGLQRVHKLFGNGLAKANVVTAPSPEPPMTTWEVKSMGGRGYVSTLVRSHHTPLT